MTQAVAFTDIKADFTNGSFFTAEETSVTTAGLKMNADGTFTRVAADAADANAVITGKFHSNEHGISNFSATVKVDGPVKVSMGTCALQFMLGHRAGKGPKDSLTAGQALGQKNTGFLIWLGYNYLTPVTSVAGGLYAIWQNLFNSWELYQKEHPSR
jgi:hypothetical protein